MREYNPFSERKSYKNRLASTRAVILELERAYRNAQIGRNASSCNHNHLARLFDVIRELLKQLMKVWFNIDRRHRVDARRTVCQILLDKLLSQFGATGSRTNCSAATGAAERFVK